MAGDRALSAMSTIIRNAKVGSCSSVRSGPNATADVRSSVVERSGASV